MILCTTYKYIFIYLFSSIFCLLNNSVSLILYLLLEYSITEYLFDQTTALELGDIFSFSQQSIIFLCRLTNVPTRTNCVWNKSIRNGIQCHNYDIIKSFQCTVGEKNSCKSVWKKWKLLENLSFIWFLCDIKIDLKYTNYRS